MQHAARRGVCCTVLCRRARAGGHTPDSTGLAPVIVSVLRPGDAVLVKGSLGSRMKLIVQALLAGQLKDTP